MVVQTLERHPGHTGLIGLYIGSVNVKQYFPRGVDFVELELDHLRIACDLDPSFWGDRPEIHDLRLSSWLEAKRVSGKLSSSSAPVAMIPSGKSSFRLQMVVRDESDHHALTVVPTVPYAAQVPSPLAAVDRRKRSGGRSPERRKVVKMVGNDLPALAANH